MSHSPSEATSATARKQYTRNWNGLVQLLRAGRSFSGRERNCCFLNTGQTRWADISSVSGLDFPEDARAVLPVDWDFDGDLDLWLVGRTAPRVRFMENRLDQQGHFLTLRLEGREANRNAVGARVELYLVGRLDQPLVQSVRAGGGFETQSSMWLHFGLGDQAGIDKIVVRWPGGKTQTFSAVAQDRWYRIVQGDQQLERWTPPVASKLATLGTGQAEIVSSSTTGKKSQAGATPAENGAPAEAKLAGPQTRPTGGTRAMILASPIPTPQLWYSAATEATTLVEYQQSEMTLINLWATWCHPCAEELRELGAAQQTLREHKLRVLALNVDKLRDSSQGSPEGADAMLDRLGFQPVAGPPATGPARRETLVRGEATEALLTKLQRLQAPLMESDPKVILPTSFLIDDQGALVAIYRGPVQVVSLLKDLNRVRRHPSGPQPTRGMFPGRWLQRPTYWELFGQLGDAFREIRMLPEALLYYTQARQLTPEHAYLRRQCEQIGAQLQGVRKMLAECREIVRVEPENAAAQARLGFAHQALGDHQQAVRHLRQAVKIEANDSQSHAALGVSLAYLGEMQPAQQQFRKAVALDPDNQLARQNLKRLQEKGSEQ